jgi:hypothetical protein
MVAQGFPPDDRVNFFRDRYFGPVEGTPLPPGLPVPPESAPPPGPPASAENPAVPLADVVPSALPPDDITSSAPTNVPGVATPPTGPVSGGPQAAPSSFGGNRSGPGPSVAIAHYDPRTGRYVAPDGQLYRQSNLVRGSSLKTWKDMLPT